MNENKKTNTIKLSVSNIAWDEFYDTNMYEYLQRMGISGIEIAPTRLWKENPYSKLLEAESYKKELKMKYGLSISSIQSIWYGMNQLLFGTKSERRELMEYTKKAILFAEVLECGNVVFGCPQNRNFQQNKDINNISEKIKIEYDFFKELGDYAFSHNTCFSIEPNPTIYKTNYINTTREAISLVKRIDSLGFRINGDTGTIIYNKESLQDIQGHVSFFNHIHVSEPGLEKITQRMIHTELLNILKNENYNGFLSIEMKKTEETSSTEEVKKAIAYLKSINS